MCPRCCSVFSRWLVSTAVWSPQPRTCELKVNKRLVQRHRVHLILIHCSQPASQYLTLVCSLAVWWYKHTQNIRVSSWKAKPSAPHVYPGLLGSTSPSFGTSEVFVSEAILDAQPLTVLHLLRWVSVYACVRCFWEVSGLCWSKKTS